MGNLVFIGDLTAYQKEIDNIRSKQYQRLLTQADRYQKMELPKIHPKESTTYIGIAIVNLALAYRLSGCKKYLDDAKRFINAVLSYEKWGNAHLVNVDLSASWILFGLSLGYDWLKYDLTDEERTRVVDKIRHHAKIMYDYRINTYGTGWSSNFYQNHNWINMTGLAAAGYVLQDDYEEGKKYVEEAKYNFERVFSYLPEDGSNYEGVVYWRYGGMWLFVYAHLLKVQEGIDYFKMSGYLKNTFYYRLYQACGDLRQQMNFGDCHDRHSGHTACVYYKCASEYGNGYAQKLGNLVVDQFLEEEASQSKVKPGILPEAVFEFLWYNPRIEEKDFSNLPLVKYFEDLGLLTVRNSWNLDSKVLTIKCGYPGGKKQWFTSHNLQKEEGIQCLSLSHHHPDNLSYIFSSGSEYLNCEDGYNRNIMPDSHNVILVDGTYADVSDVNDVYVASIESRLEKTNGQYDVEDYGGNVTCFEAKGSLVVYRGETQNIYPLEYGMKEVSRTLFTDGLKFWVYIDVCRSDKEHKYTIISNTNKRANKCDNAEYNTYVYSMDTGDIRYTVFSNEEIQSRQYNQEIISVMTTQEPDKVCKTTIETLAIESTERVYDQVIFECFTYENAGTEISFNDGVLTIKDEGKTYLLSCSPKTNKVDILVREGVVLLNEFHL